MNSIGAIGSLPTSSPLQGLGLLGASNPMAAMGGASMAPSLGSTLPVSPLQAGSSALGGGLGGGLGNQSQSSTAELLMLIEMLAMEIQQLQQELQGGGSGDGSNPISGLPSLGGGGGGGGESGGGGGGGGSVGSTGGGGSSGGGGATGPTTQTGTSAPNTGPINTQQATSGGGPQVQAMQNFANAQLGKPYEVGGGHGGWGPQSSYDCSGFVSAVLHAGGFMPNGPQATPTLWNQPGMQAGPGQHVTVYDRSQPGQEGHVIMEINNQFYECGGEHGSWGGGGGVEKIGRPTNAYLSTFDKVVHPKGC